MNHPFDKADPNGISDSNDSDLSDTVDEELVKQLDSIWSKHDSTAADPSNEPVEVGPYRLDKFLGAGAFGIVYRATDLRDGRIVALKMPRDELLYNSQAIQRFAIEFDASSRLAHPAIVPVFDSKFDQYPPYIVSEYCDGPSLDRWIADNRDRIHQPEYLLQIVLELAQGIAYAHSQCVIHRDIKPSNVLLVSKDRPTEESNRENYSVKLTDFGLARLTDMPMLDSRSSLVVGTPMYMAPEQLLPNWGCVSECTDIYSIGVVLYEIFEGRAPRHGQSYSEVILSLMRETENKRFIWTKATPQNVRQIILRCTATDPLDRYPNAESLTKDLERAVLGKTPSQSRAGFVQMFKRWARHPRRNSDVYAFLIPLNVILCVWMISNAILIAGPLYPGKERISDLTQCLAIGLIIPFTIISMSILCLRGYRQLTVALFFLILFGQILVPILALVGWIPTFGGLYANAPFFQAVNHALILCIGLVQAFALLVSMYTERGEQHRQRMGQASPKRAFAQDSQNEAARRA